MVFSNTTEVGIALAPDDAARSPGPRDRFPAKLTRFLETRARAFDYAREKGVVVIPCELIERNGDALRDLVLTLSRAWQLGAAVHGVGRRLGALLQHARGSHRDGLAAA